MSLLEKFNAMLNTTVKPKGEDTEPEDDETLSAEEKRQLAFMRKENLRQDLLRHGYGGLHRDRLS